MKILENENCGKLKLWKMETVEYLTHGKLKLWKIEIVKNGNLQGYYNF